MGRFNIFYAAVSLLHLATLGSAATDPVSYDVFESVSLPSGWKTVDGPLDPSTTLSLRIYLQQQNSDAFEKQFLEISDPDHPSYGSFLSKDQLRLQLQPDESAVSTVRTWLKENGVTDVKMDFDSVRFTVPVETAEKLLQAKYQVFENTGDGRKVIRTLEYSLPKELHDDVTLVQPTTMFGLQKRGHGVLNRRPVREVETAEDGLMRVASASAATTSDSSTLNVSVCNATITLECLSSLYGFGDYKANGNVWLGVSGFLDQYAQFDDLDQFLTKYRPSAVGGNFSVVSIDGGKNLQDPADANDAAEANLDVQYALGIAYPVNTTYYTVAGRPPYIPDMDVVTNDSEPYLEYLEYLLAQDELPSVITTSYGENEQTVPYRYRVAVCNKFKELGSRGVSVIFSSGDSGPGWSCLTNDGRNATRFLPEFPAACPWVTSVGATHHVLPEQAVYFSSGGFSDTWSQPNYQKSTIKKYLRNNIKSWGKFAKYFNSRGRAFPDVAAQGENYRVFINDEEHLLDGTSASAPAFAGIIALVNDYRVSKGKKPLGFLNPLLYKHPEAFNDITVGRSEGCNGKRWNDPIEGNPGIVEGAGWDAVKGWDPVTGLGTPNFEKLLKL